MRFFYSCFLKSFNYLVSLNTLSSWKIRNGQLSMKPLYNTLQTFEHTVRQVCIWTVSLEMHSHQKFVLQLGKISLAKKADKFRLKAVILF